MPAQQNQHQATEDAVGSYPRSPNFRQGFLYVIGCGPGGPQTATLQALDTIRRVDVIVCNGQQERLFADYINDTPVAFDPWAGFWDFEGKPFDSLSQQEAQEFPRYQERLQNEHLQDIRRMLDKGLDVGLLDFGNPCLFGPGHWYVEHLRPQEVIVIPGMGAESAALAALKASAMPAHGARFLVQSAPFFMNGQGIAPGMRLDEEDGQDQDIWPLLSGCEHSLILYMALADREKVFERLLEHLPADLPAAVVYWAGSWDKQRVVRAPLGEMCAKLADDPEHFMGLVLAGRFLEGKPFTHAQAHSALPPTRE